jgi:endosialidase-like protein
MVKARALFLGLIASLVASFTLGDEVIPNWPAPATWSPHSVSRGASTMAAITSPLPFIGVTPCRQYDSRDSSALPDNTPRAVTINGAPCGIPVIAAAVSLNVTVFDILGQGGNAVFKAGTSSPPTTAWINYPPGQGQIGNAGVLPLNGIGQIVFQVNQGGGSIDFTVDVNGYYAPAGIGTHNTFLGLNAGNFTMTGDQNTGVGHNALLSNTMGGNNSGFGNSALASNATGSHNTATGSGSLLSNTGGIQNTATGSGALLNNVLGSGNTASGAGALGNTTGDGNIGIGSFAGIFLTTGSNDICIGNAGVAGESDVIRIGSEQTKTFVAGVHAVTTGGVAVPVMIDASGQLGTVSSSARLKDEIQDMGDATDRLLRLRPVSFRYKAQPESRTQFGLIAEEVEKLMPELVVCSSSGEAETVLYHEMPAMLLNEFQKQHQTIEEQRMRIDEQQWQISVLKARFAALEEQLRERKPTVNE